MLTIEKVVKLIPAELLLQFESYLKKIRAAYPLALVQAIDKDVELLQDSDELCYRVYGNTKDKTKQKFFQLAHHTFKLTSFLSKNFPHYLSSTICSIQMLVNSGNVKKANLMLNMSYELACKIEDYNSQVALLSILSQQSNLTEQYANAAKYQEQLQKALSCLNELSEIHEYLFLNFTSKGKSPITENADKWLDKFEAYKNSNSFAVRKMATFGRSFALYYLNRPEYYTEKVYKELVYIDEQLKKYDYIVFPFLDDLSYKVTYLKLRFLLHKLDSTLILEAANQLIARSEHILFWRSYINAPELFSIAIQASYYASNYMTAYRADHLKLIPPDVSQHLDSLRSKCKSILEMDFWSDEFMLRYINLKMVYSALLMLGSQGDIKEGIQQLEGLLIVYQQVPFHFFHDGIFVNLLIGYFCIEAYDDVVSCYKRYRKLTEGKSVNTENDITIHGFYYMAQWLTSKRNQYVLKFNKIYAQTNVINLQPTRKLLTDLANYYSIPLPLQEG